MLFAAFLGYNPMKTLLGPALHSLSPARQATITGHGFFPGLISGPFHQGLSVVFTFALIVCLVAAAASWLRGGGTARAAVATPDLPDLPDLADLADLSAGEVPRAEQDAAGPLTRSRAMTLSEEA